MVKPVKKRTYNSTVRQEQAARTRARIIDAAAELFVANGYGRTSIREIAERAEVAPDTVYAVFGSKIRLLTAIIDTRLAPAGEGNVMERPEAAAVREETDQHRQVELFVRDVVTLLDRVGPIYEVLRTASAVEAEVEAVYGEMNRYRYANLRNVAGWLAANGPLRVDLDQAAETLWAVASPDTARLLRDLRGWDDDRYAAWLTDILTRMLLPDASAKRTRRATGSTKRPPGR